MGGDTQKVEPTMQEGQASKESVEMWNFYQKYYKPLRDKYITQATDPTAKAEEKANVAGQINATVMKAIGTGKISANPVENVRKLMGLGSQGSTAQTAGQGATRFRQLGAMEDIIGMGKKEEATATGSMEALAQQSEQEEAAMKQMHQESQESKAGIWSSLI